MSGTTLPKGWAASSLGDICLGKVAQSPPAERPVAYIDISSIARTTKRIGPTKTVTGADAPTRARQWVYAGDVLVSMTRPNLNAVALVGAEFDGAVASTGFDVLRSLGVRPEWLFYRVRSNEFISDVCEDLQGVVYLAIRPHDVRRHELPVPPLPEQHRIVEAIESYFTRLDDAAATLERVQRNLKRYRASLLKAAVEGRLVPTEAELARAEGRDYEPASVLLERILAERRCRWEEAELAKMKARGKTPKNDKWQRKYKEPAAPNTSVLPEPSDGWCWATTECLADVVDPQPSHRTPARAEGGVPYVGMGDVASDGTIDLVNSRLVDASVLDEHRARYKLRDGDFIFGKVGTLAAPVMLPRPFEYTLSANVVLVQPNSAIDPRFLWYWMQSPTLLRLVTADANATSQPAFGIRKVRVLPVPVPPLTEQRRIVEVVDRCLSVSASVGDESAMDKKRCVRLRQSILKWAFEGKLADQDPADEPASVLLDRIQAEREAAIAKQSKRKPRRKKKEASA